MADLPPAGTPGTPEPPRQPGDGSPWARPDRPADGPPAQPDPPAARPPSGPAAPNARPSTPQPGPAQSNAPGPRPETPGSSVPGVQPGAAGPNAPGAQAGPAGSSVPGVQPGVAAPNAPGAQAGPAGSSVPGVQSGAAGPNAPGPGWSRPGEGAPGAAGQPFGPPPVPPPSTQRRARFDWVRLAKMAGVIAPIVAGALVLILAVGTNIGPRAFAIGLAVAIIPVPFLVGCFLWLDRYEPEPWKYLAFVFGWGACVATSAALGVNTLGSYLFQQAGMSGDADAVLVAPFIEETMKALGPVLLLLFFHRKKRQPINVVDGIIYFGLSATGFAMAENILYLGGIYVTGSQAGGVAQGALMVVMLFVVRIGISGFAHPLFTSMTGIGFGLAATARDRRVRYLAPLAGWIGAMSLHSTWNLISTLGPQALFTGYAVVMAPVFFAAVGVALWARGRQGRRMARMLQPYVPAGWLSPPELDALRTMTRRMAARRWAKRVAGSEGSRAMQEYQFALSTLALARDSALSGFGADTFRDRERELLAKSVGFRQVFTGRDGTVPPAFWDGVNYHIRFPDGTVRQLPPPQRPVVPVPVVTTAYPHAGHGWW